LIVRHAILPHTFTPCDQSKEWLCANRSMTTVGFGDDEREATLDYARKAGIRHWLVEDWERAMGDEPERCSVCGGAEPCSHDFDKTNRQLEQIDRTMGTELENLDE
jgi:hypothetical protein